MGMEGNWGKPQAPIEAKMELEIGKMYHFKLSNVENSPLVKLLKIEGDIATLEVAASADGRTREYTFTTPKENLE